MCCEHMFDSAFVRRQVECLRDEQMSVVLSNSAGHKCRFGLVATFYPAKDEKEVFLRCHECGRRWHLVIGSDSLSVQPA